METPPFYRLTRRLQSVTVTTNETETRDDDARSTSAAAAAQTTTTATTTTPSTTTTTTQLLDKGHIHTKRHSADDPAKLTSASELLVLFTGSLTVSLSLCLSVMCQSVCV